MKHMIKMKKRHKLLQFNIRSKISFTMCATVLILCLLSLLAYSHPGSLDSNGGHWNRKNGTYHFHKGTNSSSDSSNYSPPEVYEPFTPPYEPPKVNPYTSYESQTSSDTAGSEDEGYDISQIVGIIILYFIFIQPVIIAICSFIYDAFLERLLPRYKIEKYADAINCYCWDSDKYDKLLIDSLFDVPPDIPVGFEIGQDGRMKETASVGWGDTFTVYIAAHGKRIHRKRNCSGATQKIHISRCMDIILSDEKEISSSISYRNYNRFSLCRKCWHDFDFSSLKWYMDYLEYEERDKEIEQLKKHLDEHKNTILTKRKHIKNIFLNFALLFCFNERKKLQKLDEKCISLGVFNAEDRTISYVSTLNKIAEAIKYSPKRILLLIGRIVAGIILISLLFAVIMCLVFVCNSIIAKIFVGIPLLFVSIYIVCLIVKTICNIFSK